MGYHSGSHYSAIQALEPFLERDQIALRFVGRPFDRVRPMLERRIDAANVFGAQYYILEQQGFRKLVDTTFIMGSWSGEDTDLEDLERYFRALRRAQREIDLEAERTSTTGCARCPTICATASTSGRFGPGERIVFEPYTREMYERTHRWMERWELFDPGRPRRPAYEDAVLT